MALPEASISATGKYNGSVENSGQAKVRHTLAAIISIQG